MKVAIDIGHIPHYQRDMHDRLINWAMWAKPGKTASICPMFMALGFKSNTRQWHPVEFRPTCDIFDAADMEKMICKLPKENRDALIWFYIYSGVSATKARKALGSTLEALNDRIIDARQMLMNRC